MPGFVFYLDGHDTGAGNAFAKLCKRETDKRCFIDVAGDAKRSAKAGSLGSLGRERSGSLCSKNLVVAAAPQHLTGLMFKAKWRFQESRLRRPFTNG